MKNTMKIVLVMALGLVMNASFAQCIKKKDDMTGSVMIDTKMVRLGNTGAGFAKIILYLEGSVTYIGDGYQLYLNAQFKDIKTIEKGSTVYVKFTDESVLQLSAENTTISEHSTGASFTQGSNNTIWSNTVRTELKPADVETLKTKKIAKIRVDTEDYIVKKTDIIPDMITCIEKTK
jgi:hypothetical protein